MIENGSSMHNELEHLESSRPGQLAARMAASYGSPEPGDIDYILSAHARSTYRLTPSSPDVGPKKLIWLCRALPLFIDTSMLQNL